MVRCGGRRAWQVEASVARGRVRGVLAGAQQCYVVGKRAAGEVNRAPAGREAAYETRRGGRLGKRMRVLRVCERCGVWWGWGGVRGVRQRGAHERVKPRLYACPSTSPEGACWAWQEGVNSVAACRRLHASFHATFHWQVKA